MSVGEAARDAESVIDLAEAMLSARAVQAVAELGVADLLGARRHRARPLVELAEETSSSPVVLGMVLRLLCAQGLFTEPASDVFALAPRGQVLRSDHPLSVRAMVRHHGFNFHLVDRLDLALRTGRPVFEEVEGKTMFDFLRANRERSAVFDAAMGDLSRLETDAVLENYDFTPYRRIVDVGGGNGTFLAAVLDGHSNASGVVLDQAHLAPVAEKVFARSCATDRLSFVDGDFLGQPPPAGDLLLLKSIVHDWPDEQAVSILRGCRRALMPGGRLVLFERLLTDDSGPSRTRNWDLLIFLILGGRERTEADLGRLLVAAGLEPVGSIRMHDTLFAVEAVAPTVD